MADILIRNVPAADVAALDKQAARLGLSRNEFLRREIHAQTKRSGGVQVAVVDLVFVEETLADLADASVMDEAWS